MKMNVKSAAIIIIIISSFTFSGCKSTKVDEKQSDNTELIEKNFSMDGQKLNFAFESGSAHNHPTFAIWIETPDGTMVQTLFVTKSIASGYFFYGDAGGGKWLKEPGVSMRPAALPYWLHRREVLNPNQSHMPTPESPVPDAYTGATPNSSFQLQAISSKRMDNRIRIFVELNQPWDWNKYWTNDKFPGDSDYKTSAQPSLVYSVEIDLSDPMQHYVLNPIGHGHPSGKDGRLYTDISGFTSALDIFKRISLTIN